jgi:hypothetical protein
VAAFMAAAASTVEEVTGEHEAGGTGTSTEGEGNHA